jgi:hypothetical protein
VDLDGMLYGDDDTESDFDSLLLSGLILAITGFRKITVNNNNNNNNLS